ncbi:MAG: hypothetical protein ACE5J5_04170 [Candidatus Hydrothermarchaeales archaeon]
MGLRVQSHNIISSGDFAYKGTVKITDEKIRYRVNHVVIKEKIQTNLPG